jgi:hypothetical protein
MRLKIIRLRWAGHEAIMEGDESSFKFLINKLSEERYSGRSRITGEDNIKQILKKWLSKRGTRVHSTRGTDYWRVPLGSISHKIC